MCCGKLIRKTWAYFQKLFVELLQSEGSLQTEDWHFASRIYEDIPQSAYHWSHAFQHLTSVDLWVQSDNTDLSSDFLQVRLIYFTAVHMLVLVQSTAGYHHDHEALLPLHEAQKMVGNKPAKLSKPEGAWDQCSCDDTMQIRFRF